MATDQIRQMVNFILQEAHEKANEIRVKVCLKRSDNIACNWIFEQYGMPGMIVSQRRFHKT